LIPLSILHGTGGFSGLSVDFLYSLYDALVSINVPSDKARAVVDAMERDMGTTLATKPDLESLRLATKQDLESLRLATKQDLELLKRDMENGFALVDQRFDALQMHLEQKIDSLRGDVSRDIAALDLKMTVKFGWMLFVGLGLVVAVLRLWV
jgi:hypothetical protein